jgi:hypothetical protein
MASKFTKAKSERGYLKCALYGKTGSGKTLTSLIWAEYLASLSGKKVYYIDTERGTEYYSMSIPERKCHPQAFDFERLITRSLMETLEAVEEPAQTPDCGVLVIDSITHIWEAARNAYQGKKMSNDQIPIQAWNGIKKPYKRLMSLFIDGNFHAILCGREGIVMEESEDGEMKVTGTKLKAEGETPHEPDILGRMIPERDSKGKYIIQVFFEKDRSGILTGKTFKEPTAEVIAPIVAYLTGGDQGKIGTPEDAAEKDMAMQEAATKKAESDRKSIYELIRVALVNATTADQLKTAWELTSGKKGKLGELYDQLVAIKDARKAEIMEAA